MALRVLPRLLYGEGHAYSLPMTGSGTEEAVAALDARRSRRRIHGTWFKPNNATMIVVGDTTLAEIQPKLESAVRALAAGRRAGEERCPTSRCPREPRVYLIDRPGAEQSVIIAGHI